MICRFCDKKLRIHNKTGLCSAHYFREREKLPHRKEALKMRQSRLLKTDPQNRLSKYMRNTIYIAMRANKNFPKAEKFLGCDIYTYRKYLENKFEAGMSWENYGEWHIDHIKPLFRFNLENTQEFLEASHFSNTQPLWAKDNLLKRDLELRGTP